MERIVKEIGELWYPARKTLEAERESLRAEREKFLREYQESHKGGGFSQVLKNTFAAAFPFSARNQELKRHDAGIEAKSSELLSRAKSAYASLEARALEKSRDPTEDERYGSMRQVVSETRSARLKVNEAARLCREAANWTRGSLMSNTNNQPTLGMSTNSTRIAEGALREASRSLSNLEKNLEMPSFRLSVLTEGIGLGNSLRAMTVGMYGNSAISASMGVQQALDLENAESTMRKVSAQLDRLEAEIQGRIDSRGAEALARLRREDPNLNSLLESLHDYVSGTR